jgi:hypothetical protein
MPCSYQVHYMPFSLKFMCFLWHWIKGNKWMLPNNFIWNKKNVVSCRSTFSDKESVQSTEISTQGRVIDQWSCSMANHWDFPVLYKCYIDISESQWYMKKTPWPPFPTTTPNCKIRLENNNNKKKGKDKQKTWKWTFLRVT